MSVDKEYKYLGSGRNRHVFLLPSGRNVIKVPINEAGRTDNYLEAVRFKKSSINSYASYARCRLLNFNQACLIMEYVKPVLFISESYASQMHKEARSTEYCTWFAEQDKYTIVTGDSPDWVKCIDCAQVGLNLKGKLVAYDYGN